MKNYKVKVTETNGTAAATVEERSFFEACGDAITTLVSDSEASVGYAKTAVHAGLIYGGMVFAAYRQTGRLSWNPF